MAVEVKKISTSWYSSGTTVEEVRAEKPEDQIGCLSNQAAALPPKRQPMATKRYVIPPVSGQHII